MNQIIALAAGHDLLIDLLQESQTGGNVSGWVWLIIILFVILVVAWRLISNRGSEDFPLEKRDEHGEHSEAVNSEAMEASRAAAEVQVPAPAIPPQKPDDLVIIEGIGPKINSVLQANGITTFAQLASTPVEQLKQILLKEELRLADPATWPEQARLAAASDMDGLNTLQGGLKGGRQV